MVTIKPNDQVAQRPDAIVKYQASPQQGWHGGVVTIERWKPRGEHITLPEVTAQSGTDFTIVAHNGVPGAQYRVVIGDQSWLLTVSWLVPCRPTGVRGAVKGVTTHVLTEGHVAVADQPIDLGTYHLVLAEPQPRRRR